MRLSYAKTPTKSSCHYYIQVNICQTQLIRGKKKPALVLQKRLNTGVYTKDQNFCAINKLIKYYEIKEDDIYVAKSKTYPTETADYLKGSGITETNLNFNQFKQKQIPITQF